MLSSSITGRSNGTGARRRPMLYLRSLVVVEPDRRDGEARLRRHRWSGLCEQQRHQRHSGGDIEGRHSAFRRGPRASSAVPSAGRRPDAAGHDGCLRRCAGSRARRSATCASACSSAPVREAEGRSRSQMVETDYVFAWSFDGAGLHRARIIDVIVTGGTTDNDSRRLVAYNLAPGGLRRQLSYKGLVCEPRDRLRRPASRSRQQHPDDARRTAALRRRTRSGLQRGRSAQNLVVDARTFDNLEGRLKVAFAGLTKITAGVVNTTVMLGGLAMQRIGGQTVNTVLIGQNLSFVGAGRRHRRRPLHRPGSTQRPRLRPVRGRRSQRRRPTTASSEAAAATSGFI